MKVSTVKPQVVPFAVRINDISEEDICPPTPLQVIQQIVTNLCAIPAAELTDDALMAPLEEKPSTSS